MTSPFLPSGKLRPTGAIREILNEDDSLLGPQVVAVLREQRPDFEHISRQKLLRLANEVRGEKGSRPKKKIRQVIEILQAIIAKGQILSSDKIVREHPNIFGDISTTQKLKNARNIVTKAARSIDRTSSKYLLPYSYTDKMKAHIRAAGRILTKRQIVSVLDDRPWQFERLEKTKRKTLYDLATKAACTINHRVALNTVQETAAQLLANACLSGRDISSAHIHTYLHKRRARNEISQEGDIQPAAIDKIREPLELSLFTECATGPLKKIAKALQKFPADYSDEEARLIRAMMQAVLPDYPVEQLTKERLQRVTYQGYNPKVRAVFKATGYELETLLASRRLIPLAARCVFTHAKNNENGILLWYKAPPHPTDAELLAEDRRREQRQATRLATRSRPEAA